MILEEPDRASPGTSGFFPSVRSSLGDTRRLRPGSKRQTFKSLKHFKTATSPSPCVSQPISTKHLKEGGTKELCGSHRIHQTRFKNHGPHIHDPKDRLDHNNVPGTGGAAPPPPEERRRGRTRGPPWRGASGSLRGTSGPVGPPQPGVLGTAAGRRCSGSPAATSWASPRSLEEARSHRGALEEVFRSRKVSPEACSDHMKSSFLLEVRADLWTTWGSPSCSSDTHTHTVKPHPPSRRRGEWGCPSPGGSWSVVVLSFSSVSMSQSVRPREQCRSRSPAPVFSLKLMAGPQEALRLP